MRVLVVQKYSISTCVKNVSMSIPVCIRSVEVQEAVELVIGRRTLPYRRLLVS